MFPMLFRSLRMAIVVLNRLYGWKRTMPSAENDKVSVHHMRLIGEFSNLHDDVRFRIVVGEIYKKKNAKQVV